MLIQAGQDRNRQDFDTVLCLHRRAQDVIVSMHGGKIDHLVPQFEDGRFDGFGDVEEFKVNKNLFAAFPKPLDQIIVTPGHENLQTEFVENHGVSKLLHPLLSFLSSGNIESKNEPILYRDRFLGQESATHNATSIQDRSRENSWLLAVGRWLFTVVHEGEH